MPASSLPELDDELRQRLGRRFGSAINEWLDALPAVLEDLAEAVGASQVYELFGEGFS